MQSRDFQGEDWNDVFLITMRIATYVAKQMVVRNTDTISSLQISELQSTTDKRRRRPAAEKK
jgi:hypothetical protein